MIKIICPSCGFSKDIDEGGVPENAATVICPVCGENFDFSAGYKKKASVFSRGLAVIIDFLILNIFNLFISFLLDLALTRILAFAGIDEDLSFKLMGGIIYFTWIISMFGYFTFAVYRYGKTLGKKILGIKVINEKGGLPTLEQCIKREIFGKVLSGMTLGIGFLWAVFDGNRQALHDKLAKTYVVYV